MSREWFSKEVGQQGLIKDTEDGGAMMPIPLDTDPQVVRLPPELGGHVVRVLGMVHRSCPKCGGPRNVKVLVLEDHICVAECMTDGFVWYRVPA